MRRRPGQTLQLRVAPAAVHLACTGGWRTRAGTPLGQQLFVPDSGLHGEFAAIGKALAQLFAARDYAGWPVTIVLDDALSRLWPVALPQGAASLADIEAAAALRFQALYGDAPDLWQTSRAWRADAPFFCAVPRALLAQVTRAATGGGLAIIAMVPQFVASWNRWQGALKPGAWFGQLQEQMLTLGVLHQGRLQAVRAISVPQGAPRQWLEQAVAREALLHGVSAPGLLQLCGAAPPAWLAPPAAGSLVCSVFQHGGDLA